VAERLARAGDRIRDQRGDRPGRPRRPSGDQ
jgi:hypothetical protein